MPGDNKKRESHVARKALQKNANLLEALLETDPKKQDPEVLKRGILFAKVIKNLGPVFQIAVPVKGADGRERLVEVYGSGKGQMKQKNTKLKISAGSLVMVEGFQLQTVAGRTTNVEIVGMCLRKEIQLAGAQKRISPLVWDGDDGMEDVFDRTEEVEEGEEEGEGERAAGGGGGARRPREVKMSDL